jgi:hypothetical protein
VQGAPIHRNFAAADPEKTAEIDHRGANPAAVIDDHVDDVTHIFVVGVKHLPAQNTLDFVAVEHCHRRRFRGAGRGVIGGHAWRRYWRVLGACA